MAVALHRATRLPICGLYDAHGDCHHVFVMAQDGRGIDARGLQSVEKLKAGCTGQELRPMCVEDVAKWVGRELSAAEVRAARRVIDSDPVLRAAVARVTRDAPNHDR